MSKHTESLWWHVYNGDEPIGAVYAPTANLALETAMRFDHPWNNIRVQGVDGEPLYQCATCGQSVTSSNAVHFPYCASCATKE